MTIQTILAQIDLGSYALPEFQRGYVWNRDQVRKLMLSLYRGYPIGGLLVWVTENGSANTRGENISRQGSVNLILDGQQRITTLYGIIRGQAPKFFEGNAATFTGLYFNLDEEIFEFYSQQKMKDNPSWISVTELLQKGSGNFISDECQKRPERAGYLLMQIDKLNKIDNIKNVDLHIQEVAGVDKTIDVVVEIFNNVNSGGTKLSKGDLALAKVCSQWPEARQELRDILEHFRRAGYSFTLEWLLRCITVYLTNRPYFNELEKVSIEEIKSATNKAKDLIGDCLNHIGSRLGLDHDRVLGGRYAIATMVGYLHIKGDKLSDAKEWDKLLYWYVHSFLWGRYAGSTESVMAQDLNVIAESGIEGAIGLLRQNRGDLVLKPEDFLGWSTGARFFPLLYMITRVAHSRDFSTGVELNNNLLGHNSSLEVHHIFPKARLYAANKKKPLVNSLGNYAFITKDTNLEISEELPETYIPKYMNKNPGAIESHWIPTESALWKIENYEAFLAKRRALLAEGANRFLDSLYRGEIAAVAIENYSGRSLASAQAEDEAIDEIIAVLESHNIDSGIRNYELTDDQGNVLAIFDLAWPQGIQTGLGEPVAVLIDEDEETYRLANAYGYKYFVSSDDFLKYVKEEHII